MARGLQNYNNRISTFRISFSDLSLYKHDNKECLLLHVYCNSVPWEVSGFCTHILCTFEIAFLEMIMQLSH